MNNEKYWKALEHLVSTSKIIIDRPKGTRHPTATQIIYPLDYGYLEGTSAGDGEGIDIWLGSQKGKQVDAIICSVDLTKRDAEIKILIGCTEQEKETIHKFHNQLEPISGILIKRSK